MSQINPYIADYKPKDYGGVDASRCVLNCSLGVNCQPLPEAVLQTLTQMSAEPGIIKQYPHHEDVDAQNCGYLREQYKHIAPQLRDENFWFGDGSFDLLCGLNLLYGNPDVKIMGEAPQFTAYVDHVHCIGVPFAAYPLNKEKNYLFEPGAFCDMVLKERPALICCENPNNPTGQGVGMPGLRQIVEAARQVNAAVVFDEAYGDYLPASESAIPLIFEGEKQGVDVFVTRTFSKGYGMAGIRMGYVMGPAPAVTQLKKLVTPFNCNSAARFLVRSVLANDPGFQERLSAKTKEINERLYDEIRNIKNAAGGQKYHIAETSLYSPIFTLYVDDESLDLCQALAEVGLAVVSCATYENLGQNAVRVMLCEDIDLLIELLKKANV